MKIIITALLSVLFFLAIQKTALASFPVTRTNKEVTSAIVEKNESKLTNKHKKIIAYGLIALGLIGFVVTVNVFFMGLPMLGGIIAMREFNKGNEKKSFLKIAIASATSILAMIIYLFVVNGFNQGNPGGFGPCLFCQ